MNRIENFLFVKNNRTAYDVNGAKKVVSLKNPAIEAFYRKENILKMKSMLEAVAAQQAFYAQIKRKDMPFYDLKDECFNQIRMQSQLVPQYAEQELAGELGKFFPSVDVQERIIATRSQILVKALVWWAKTLQALWQNNFGKTPEFFSPLLKLHLA